MIASVGSKLVALFSTASPWQAEYGRVARSLPCFVVLTVDILLRTLQEHTPQDSICIRAFADDVGMLMIYVSHYLPRNLQTYARLVALSGLTLNLQKTVVTPLGHLLGRSRKETHKRRSQSEGYALLLLGSYSTRAYVGKMPQQV